MPERKPKPTRLAATLLALLATSCDACGSAPVAGRAGAPAPGAIDAPAKPGGWLKGQLHLHSNRSGDSNTPPERVASWYAEHGFDFIVFTDHNQVTRVEAPRGMLTLAGVELTQNLATCEPPPEPGKACLLHVDALFVEASAPSRIEWPEPTPSRRLDLYGRAVDLSRDLGGLAQLNHPNFHHGADADILLALTKRGLELVEIANMAFDSDNEGDATHPSTEALWDDVLSRGAHVFATATDDAHDYDDAEAMRRIGQRPYIGDLGFVMVRASKEAKSIRDAVSRGDFYASTGVLLDRVELDEHAIALEVASNGDATFEVIGTRGATLSTSTGRSLRFDPRTAPPGYVRVRVTSAGKRAWTQPVWTSGGR